MIALATLLEDDPGLVRSMNEDGMPLLHAAALGRTDEVRAFLGGRAPGVAADGPRRRHPRRFGTYPHKIAN